MEQRYSDQIAFFNPETWHYPVHLIGAGGINNLVGPALAKMGVQEIHVWDDDILEERNCPTEIAYSYRMTGHHKTAAMADIANYLMPESKIIEHRERLRVDSEISGVIISGVDSMKSRKIIWATIQKRNYEIPLYIDGRSAGRTTQIFALNPLDADACSKYASWLFDDSKAKKLACGARNFPPVSLYMAAEITRIVADFHAGKPIEFRTSRKL